MREAIERLSEKECFSSPDRELLDSFLDQLESGELRAAEQVEGRWRAVPWVKMGILAGFRMGVLTDYSVNNRFCFFDKDTYPPQTLSLDSGVRLVPGGSAIRRGSYVAPGVTCMPPMYINVGAYVGQGTMVDSHALIGSCAQIGRGVHVSAAAQIGGVLEPVGAVPVVVEDEVLVGGNCGVYEGTIVRKGAVLGAGVILTRALAVYDLVRETVYKAEQDGCLEIPEGAVVVAGSRPVQKGFGREQGLSTYCPVIVKYRDWKTEKSVQLEEVLR